MRMRDSRCADAPVSSPGRTLDHAHQRRWLNWFEKHSGESLVAKGGNVCRCCNGGGAGDDGNVSCLAIGLESGQHVRPAQEGHREVENHDIGLLTANDGERGQSVGGNERLAATVFQNFANDHLRIWIIVDDEHPEALRFCARGVHSLNERCNAHATVLTRINMPPRSPSMAPQYDSASSKLTLDNNSAFSNGFARNVVRSWRESGRSNGSTPDK